MSEQPRNPLAAIESMEAAAFRVGQLARRLLREHADLPPLRITAFASDGLADLDLQCDAPDDTGLQAWATALGAELVHTLGNAYGPGGFDRVKGKTEIDGVTVTLSGTYLLDTAEWEARHVVVAEQLAEVGESA